jgi:serine/threonine-protein kinase
MEATSLHHEAKRVFLAALEHPACERERYVLAACSDDTVRAEVLRLLAHAPRTSLDTEGVARTAAASAQTQAAPARYEPGTHIAERYRLERRIGVGGMGELYLAHDTLLDQSVALKFPALALTGDARAVALLLDEARSARAVVHPGVCRMFDAGLHEGQPFLTMEYVEGENLSERLCRTGPLAGAELRRLALELADALAAIHACGWLHRDLKPANVMLDAAGRVRLTDFGVAARLGAVGLLAGTPGYLAPELFLGAPASVSSDIHGWALVLHEAATGQRFSTHAPSALPRDLDPVLERLLVAGLAPAPAARPASAGLLVQVLGTSDPLEAVLLLGERPSPKVIAASQARGLLGRRAALGLGALALMLLAAQALVQPRVFSLERAGLARAPDDAAREARRLVERVLPGRSVGAHAWGYDQLTAEPVPGLHYARGLLDTPGGTFFWYRESSTELVNTNALDLVTRGARVDLMSPPPSEWGSVAVATTCDGRLFFFQHTPAPDPTTARASPVDWSSFYAAAGLDPGALTPSPTRLPLVSAADRRDSYTLQLDGRETRLETGSLGGVPTLFSLTQVAQPQDGDVERVARARLAFDYVYLAAPLLFVGLLVPAWINLRAGLADPWGAFRLALFTFITAYDAFLLSARHRASGADEAMFLVLGLAGPLLRALGLWGLYMGTEPWVQRFWPRCLVSWSRLLAGRLFDPLVGSHVLIGLIVGMAFALAELAHGATAAWVLGSALPVAARLPQALPGMRDALATLCGLPNEACVLALLFLALLGLARLVLRSTLLALVAAGTLFAFETLLTARVPYAALLWLVLPQVVLGAVILLRYGLLPYATALATLECLRQFPMGFTRGSWHLGVSLLGVVILVAVALVALAVAWRLPPQPRSTRYARGAASS